jgi:hypothetical protein
MARLVIVLLAIVTGCAAPSLKDRARSLGSNMADLGKRVATVVTPKVKVSPDVRAVVVAAAEDRARHAVATRVAQQEPITFQKTVRREPQRARRVEPQPTVEPTVTVDRVDASRPIKFVLRSQIDGGKSQCEAYDTMESCTASCTNLQRPQMFDAKAPKVTCSCLEQDGGC